MSIPQEQEHKATVTVWHVTRKSFPGTGYYTDKWYLVEEEKETDKEYCDEDDVVVEEVEMSVDEWKKIDESDEEFMGW